MGNTAKVVGMMPVDERVKDVAHRILDDVVSVQTAISGQDYVPVVVRSGLNAIQVQARSLLSGGKMAPIPDGPLSQEYRQDMLKLLEGLLDLLLSKVSAIPVPGQELADEELQIIAVAASIAGGRINNYLTVKRAENRMQRREGGNELAPAAA